MDVIVVIVDVHIATDGFPPRTVWELLMTANIDKSRKVLYESFHFHQLLFGKLN